MQSSEIVESDSEENDIPLENNQFTANQPEIEHIIAQNQQLISDNTILKTQLQNALDFQNEIKEKQKNLYDENSQLKTKLLESNQNIDQLKQRLQISQQKSQDSENNIMKLESNIQKTNEEKEALTAHLDSLNIETTKLNEKIESLNSELNNNIVNKSNFLNESSKLFEQTFSNLEDVLAFLQNSKKEKDDKTSENNDKLSSELQDAKQLNQKLLKKIEKYKKMLQETVKANQELEESYNECLSNQKKMEEDNSSVMKENQSMNSELDILKEKLKFAQIRLDQNKQERETELEKYKKIAEAKDQRINELKKIVTDPIRSGTNENQKLIQELSETKGKLNDLSQTNSDLLQAIDILRSKLSKATYKTKKQKMVNEQLKNQFEQVSKKQALNDEKVTQIANKNMQLSHENEDLQSEIDNLKTQLKAALASHVEGESAWNEKAQEVIRLNNSLKSIENIVEKQRKDIEVYSEEKKQMLQLIHKMYDMSLNYDSLLTDEIKKNTEQQSQIKRLNKKLQKNEDLESRCQSNSKLIDSIKEYLYSNFDEKLKFNFIQILNDDNLDSNGKIFKVIETLKQAFQEIDDKLQGAQAASNTMNTNCQDMKNALDQNRTLLTCLLSSFKRILDGDSNQKMTDFLAIQIARLEAQLRPNNQSTSNSQEILSNIEDLKKRGFDSGSAFDLFTIQSLTNAELCNQLEYLRSLTSEQNDQIQQITSAVGSNDFSEIVDVMKSLKSENRKLQKLQKKMSVNNTYQKENQELKEKVDQLQKDLKSLVSDATTLQNELDLKTNQFNSLEESHSLLMKESSELQSKHLKEVGDFETIIDARNREIRDLTIKLTQIQSESTDQIERLKKSNTELKNLNEKRKNQFKKTVALLQERKKNKEEQWSNRLKAAENHHKEEMDQCQQDIEALNAKLVSTTETSKKSSQEKDELNEKLADSLKKSEERNQKMTNDISKLTIANKTLESQIQSMHERMKRETQLLKTQFTFDSMKNETQFKETITQLKTQMKKEKNDLIFLVLSNFDEIDDFDADDIDDETFKHTVEKLGKEFRTTKKLNQLI